MPDWWLRRRAGHVPALTAADAAVLPLGELRFSPAWKLDRCSAPVLFGRVEAGSRDRQLLRASQVVWATWDPPALTALAPRCRQMLLHPETLLAQHPAVDLAVFGSLRATALADTAAGRRWLRAVAERDGVDVDALIAHAVDGATVDEVVGIIARMS